MINKIRQNMSHYSKGQKLIANYIIENYEKAAFMTAKELGNTVGVSESTVVRFACVLGFEGFPEMQKCIKEMVMQRIDSFERIEVATDNSTTDTVFANVINADIASLKQTLAMCDMNSFSQAVDMISKAKNIYIVGIKECAPLAINLGMGLGLIFAGVTIIDSCNTSEIFEQLIHVSQSDVVIGISFPRYSMRTLKALEFARDRNAHVIAITDTIHSPIGMYSTCKLVAPTKLASLVESYVAPLSLINALVVAVNINNKELAIRNNELLESICRDYQYNDSDEIDYLSEDLGNDLDKLS